MPRTAQEKLEALERELDLRRRVYPKQIERGHMTPSFADRQISIFEEIAEDYRGQVEKERLL